MYGFWHVSITNLTKSTKSATYWKILHAANLFSILNIFLNVKFWTVLDLLSDSFDSLKKASNFTICFIFSKKNLCPKFSKKKKTLRLPQTFHSNIFEYLCDVTLNLKMKLIHQFQSCWICIQRNLKFNNNFLKSENFHNLVSQMHATNFFNVWRFLWTKKLKISWLILLQICLPQIC